MRPGRQLPGWRAKRRSYRPISPSNIIAQYLESRQNKELSNELWGNIRALARDRSVRLPVMTAQMMWYRDEELRQTDLMEQLPRGKNWNRRVKAVCSTGVTVKDLASWSWILKGDTADIRLERFLSVQRHKPIFLLFLLVRSDQPILNRELFVSLLDHITKIYTNRTPMGTGEQQKRALDSAFNMTPKHFLVLLERLMFHTTRLSPESALQLAQFVISYINSRSAMGTVSEMQGGPQPEYAASCRIFNAALRLLSTPAKSRPLANMEHNWEAQKHLLAFSSGLRQPLIINQSGYRAIQAVMIGREKSAGEVKVAVRSVKTWPPYRRAWDGIDEQRRPEDDLSRAVKAGIQAREAGYPEIEYDRALGALGGHLLGQSPTVQTRSTPPVLRRAKNAAVTVLDTWAARIKATRNAQEAWAIFRTPPQDNLKPSVPVYAAMMAKIVAGEVTDSASAVPGSSRENFPVHQSPNLSEYEKARIRPPTLEKLAEEMVASGVRPTGLALCILIEHSRSESEMLHWLRLSPYERLAHELDPLSEAAQRNYETLKHVPLAVFNAYISFLCKMQRKEDAAASADQQGDSHPQSHPDSRPRDYYIKLALQLIPARLPAKTREGRTYKPPWLQVLQTLIMSKSHASLRNPSTRRSRLMTFLNASKLTAHRTGMDAALLGLICLSAGRVMAATFTAANRDQYRDRYSARDRWWMVPDSIHLDAGTKSLLEQLYNEATNAFADLKPTGSGIGGFHVYSYVRMLALYGDVDRMVKALEWALLWLEKGRTLDGAATGGTSSNEYLNLAFAIFEILAKDRVPDDVIRAIEARRQALVEIGYPLEVPELSEMDLEDVALVSVVAKGWVDVSNMQDTP